MHNLILPLAGAFVIIVLILVRRSAKVREEKNARRRSTRSGLVLERASKGKKGGRPSYAGPVLIVLALLVIGAWLAAAYLNPAGPAASGGTGSETTAEAGAAEDSRVMSGRIVMGQDATPAAPSAPMAEAAARAGSAGVAAAQSVTPPPQDPAAAPPRPPVAANPAVDDPLARAARAVSPTISRMEQVGLLPSRGGGAKPAPAPKPRTPAPAPATQTADAGQAAASPATPAGGGGDREILGGAREFTVHLGSFAERANAEKYLGQLAAAQVRESFITESTVGDRLWYRVMSGRFASQAEAEAYGGELRRRGLTASGGRYVIKSIP